MSKLDTINVISRYMRNMSDENVEKSYDIICKIAGDNFGEISDGDHTFNELYKHRMVLTACIANGRDSSWKSKLHSDGTMFDNMFIVGINTPYGNVTYHYYLDDWDRFKVNELPQAPEFDGCSPEEGLNRLTKTFMGGN